MLNCMLSSGLELHVVGRILLGVCCWVTHTSLFCASLYLASQGHMYYRKHPGFASSVIGPLLY